MPHLKRKYLWCMCVPVCVHIVVVYQSVQGFVASYTCVQNFFLMYQWCDLDNLFCIPAFLGFHLLKEIITVTVLNVKHQWTSFRIKKILWIHHLNIRSEIKWAPGQVTFPAYSPMFIIRTTFLETAPYPSLPNCDGYWICETPLSIKRFSKI